MNPEEMSMVKAALTPVVQDVQDQGMWIFFTIQIFNRETGSNVWFISYSKCSNWSGILKLSSDFGCLFSFGYSAWAN